MTRAQKMLTALVLLLGTWAPAAALAQTTPGRIVGRVTMDADGSAIHGASVIVVGGRRAATTDDEGRFAIEGIPPGEYQVLAQREHLTASRQTVNVAAGQTVNLDFTLTLEAIHEEVAVTASASGTGTAFDSFSAVTSLDSLELAVNRGASIASVLAEQPGVSLRSFGPGNARPVIRGFDGDRVLVMQDGVRTGDLSSQSGDHGMSIDPSGLERVEVVRGPATLLYGSNAIGGVVNAITPQDAFRASPFIGVLGGVSFDAGSGNDQAGGSANVQYGKGGWTAWGGGGIRRTQDYETPLGTVKNSDTDLRNGRGGVGWTGTRTFVSVGVQGERSRYGVPFAGAFENADEPVDIDLKSVRQDLRIDGGLRSLESAFLDNVKLTVATSSYRHEEIEVVDGADEIGTRFFNDTLTSRLELEQKRTGRLTGRLGVDWFARDYHVEGEEALAPATEQVSFAAFAYEELGFGQTRLQVGGRLERTRYRPEAREINVDADGEEPPPVRSRAFTGTSASVGVHRDLGRGYAVVANLSAASRAPALEELYNFGPHIGNLAFEIGNADLDVERSVGIDASVRHRSARMSAELNVFSYGIDNFVFLDFTGEVREGLREARFVQGDSRYSGLEASGDLQMGRGVHAEASVSLVRAALDNGENLPRIPPMSGRVQLEVPWRRVTFTPEVVVTAAQDRVFRDETRTPGNTRLNLAATFFLVRGHATHALTFKARNLTNEEARLHTSFIKDLAPEMGRSLTATYTLRFF